MIQGKIVTFVMFIYFAQKGVAKLVDINRIYALAKQKGIKNAYIAERCGRSRAFLTNVKNGNDSISEANLAIIADILDTTPEYLRGETDRKEKTPAEPASVRSDIAEFMEKVSQLPPDAVSRLNDLADLILSARDGKK